jgi:sulfatase maturation enzyme AslB (radical SAM superfamily)
MKKRGLGMPHINKQMVSFFLTTKCNLCCEYRYNIEQREQKEEQTLPFEVTKAGLDYYFSHNGNSHSVDGIDVSCMFEMIPICRKCKSSSS